MSLALGAAVLVAGCETGGVDERERIAVPQLRMEPGGELLLEASERIASRDDDQPLLEAQTLRREVFLALGDDDCQQFGTVARTPIGPSDETGTESTGTDGDAPPMFELTPTNDDIARLNSGVAVDSGGRFVVLWSAPAPSGDDVADALPLDTSEIGFTRAADVDDSIVLMLDPAAESGSVRSTLTSCTRRGADGSTSMASFDPDADEDGIETLDELNAGIAFAGAAPGSGAMIPIPLDDPFMPESLATITTVPRSPLALERTLPPSWSLSIGDVTRARLELTPDEDDADTLALNISATDSGTSLIIETVFDASVRPAAGQTIDVMVMHGDMPGDLMAGSCIDMPDEASSGAMLPYTFMEPPSASNMSVEGYYRVDAENSDVVRCEIGNLDADEDNVVRLMVDVTVTAAEDTMSTNGTAGSGPNPGGLTAADEPRLWSWNGDVVIHRPQPEQPTSR